MKRFFLSTAILLSFLSSAMALVRPTTILIPLIKIENIASTKPSIRPFANPDEESYFTAILTDEAVVVTSEAITAEVSILIEDETGSIVAFTTSSMTIGTEIELPIANLSAGSYTLYIIYGNNTLAGDFEL